MDFLAICICSPLYLKLRIFVYLLLVCNRKCGDNNHDGVDVDVNVDACIEPSYITHSSQNWCCEGFLKNSSWFRSLLPTLSQVMFFHSHVSLFFWVVVVVGLC